MPRTLVAVARSLDAQRTIAAVIACLAGSSPLDQPQRAQRLVSRSEGEETCARRTRM